MVLAKNALCTVEDVKALVDPEMSSAQDALITLMINQFSALAESKEFCNRKFEKKLYTDYRDGGVSTIVVDAPPVVVNDNLSLFDDPDQVFGDATKLDLYDDYALDAESGVIKYRWGIFSCYPHTVKIQYNGGVSLVDQEANIIDIPYDLRGAAAMQVSFWYKNRQNLGLSSLDFGGGQATIFNPTKMLPNVMHTLMAYRRFEY